ncbi:membrane protein [Pectobacterium carotovorum subsp. carotovorum]|nr:membrane protein [Pectobacterium carotovorum subsp. carotovorum]
MLSVIMIVLAVVGGALLSVQAAINARLAATQGAIRTTFLTFLVGTAFSAVMVIFLEPPHEVTLFDVPKWQLLGSLFGLIYVLSMVFAVQKIGTAIATVAVILGQLSMSIIIDTFGWLGNQAIDFSIHRVLAAVCLAIALWFIYRSSSADYKKSDDSSLSNVKNESALS